MQSTVHVHTVVQILTDVRQAFRSFTYSQSGFKLNKKGGQTVQSLSKLADIPIRLHRSIPEDTKPIDHLLRVHAASGLRKC